MTKKVFYFIICLAAMVIFIFLPNLLSPKSTSAHPLPLRNSNASDSLIPEIVMKETKHVIAITQRTESSSLINSLIKNSSEAWGTGFSVQQGVFVSAGHILSTQAANLAHIGHVISFDKFGIPKSDRKTFMYTFTGTTNINNKSEDFSFRIAGLGNLINQFKDIVVLVAETVPTGLKTLKLNPNALKLDEKIYASGYIFQKIAIGQGGRGLVLFDVIKKTQPGMVDAVIENLPINDLGVKRFYRINGQLELGYSGGPILNSAGEVVGMIILRSQNQFYAISSQDVINYVNEFKNLGANLKSPTLNK